jgi:hypothetical protein
LAACSDVLSWSSFSTTVTQSSSEAEANLKLRLDDIPLEQVVVVAPPEADCCISHCRTAPQVVTGRLAYPSSPGTLRLNAAKPVTNGQGVTCVMTNNVKEGNGTSSIANVQLLRCGDFLFAF